jgi:3-oxoacyl-[acyl-carrier protein] reductase
MGDAKTALVLGASGGLGQAIARRLASDGFRLGLHAHQHPERLPQFPNAQTYAADLAKQQDIKTLASSFLKDFGRLDALVWAAGVACEAPVLKLAEDDLRAVLSVNLSAPFLLAKAVSRQFLRQKSGCFVLLSSQAGLRGRAGGAAYATAQSGVLALMRSLAREWGPLGVRVNAVVPPFIPDSDLGRTASANFVESVKRQRVYTGEGEPSRVVAECVSGLIASPTTSGQIFVVDARIPAC